MSPDTTAAHTPGPWRLDDKGAGRRIVKGDEPERSVCIIESWTKEADARLIAAAPEMQTRIQELETERADAMAALERSEAERDEAREQRAEMLEALKRVWRNSSDPDAIEAVRLAIARAEGRS
jgi:hypothetical protein